MNEKPQGTEWVPFRYNKRAPHTDNLPQEEGAASSLGHHPEKLELEAAKATPQRSDQVPACAPGGFKWWHHSAASQGLGHMAGESLIFP